MADSVHLTIPTLLLNRSNESLDKLFVSFVFCDALVNVVKSCISVTIALVMFCSGKWRLLSDPAGAPSSSICVLDGFLGYLVIDILCVHCGRKTVGFTLY